ncbi:MAG: fibronectin type III domain-containing protein, partial [Oscillospiraceae bacterium]|nr:fibronectin type III domain-containing protein [Oscillospiraceae bacterium]
MKKQIIKKKIAFLLALCMVSNFSITVGAKDTLSGFGVSKVETLELTPQGEESDPDTLAPEPTSEPAAESTTQDNPVENAGRVEVSLGMALFLDKAEFTVKLTGNNYHGQHTVAFENKNINLTPEEMEAMEAAESENEETASESSGIKNADKTVVFSHLESGSYMLTITANGFKTYTQEIKVEQKKHVLKLTAGFCADYDYEKGLIHPGVLLIGDVDGNGYVDDADRKVLVSAIHTVKRFPEQLGSFMTCDLNGDGDVNIEDLMFFSKGYLEDVDKHTSAHIEEYVSPDLVKVDTPANVEVVGGSVQDMMDGKGEVSFGLKEGEELSEDNPITVSFDVTSEEPVEAVVFGVSEKTPIEKAYIDVNYVDEDGTERTLQVPLVTYESESETESESEITEDENHPENQPEEQNAEGEQYPSEPPASTEDTQSEPLALAEVSEVSRRAIEFLLQESNVRATLDKKGNIQVNLGKQVAVKKVSLNVTALAVADGQANNLVTIAKTEFVNDMASRIPEPELNIPLITDVKIGSEEFTVTWNPETNVTGYEVQVKQGGKVIKTIPTTANTVKVKEDKVIKNYVTYTVSVKSVNGTWSSAYGASRDAMPLPTKRPDKPDNVKASGIHRGIKVSWSNMDDTQSYILYYRKEGDTTFTEIQNITSNGYTIEGLEDVTEYEVYVKGKNTLGLSPESIHTAATTTDLDLADMPKYNLINRDEKGRPGKTHVLSVKRYGGSMIDSKLDTDGSSAWGAVDGAKISYYSKATWDDGGFNGIGNNGLTYTLDQDYTMDTIGILTTTSIDYTNVRCWDSAGNLVYQLNDGYSNLTSYKTDAKGRGYYLLKFPKAITASKIQISLARYLASPITISETYFYHYDTLMDEVMDLYIDDLHTVLKDYVTQDTIDELRDKINTPDEFGEVNPNKAAALRELETAEKILNAKSISSAVEIHTGITTKDAGRGFSGLNAWQPLGVSIGTGEEVTIYVGSNKKKTGDSTNLRLITTQYHSESGGVTLDGANLKVGANTFKLSQGKLVGFESGGALYVQYQGDSNTDERYSVRVTGGSEIPILDLYQVTDETERTERAVAYINELDEYVPSIEAKHNEVHKGSGNKKLDYNFDRQNCILGASDVLLDTMMLSLPAQQMLAGTGNGSAEERAAKLLQSMDAMEDMMY